MTQRALVFFHRWSQVPAGANILRHNTNRAAAHALLDAFAEKRIARIYCHAANATGWTVEVAADDPVQVEFLGDGWTDAERKNASAHIRRADPYITLIDEGETKP